MVLGLTSRFFFLPEFCTLASQQPLHLAFLLYPKDSHILNIWRLLSLWLLLASNPACIFRDFPAPSPLLPPCDPGAAQLGSVLPPRSLGIWRCVRVGDVVHRELNMGKSFLPTLSRSGVHALHPSAWIVAMGTPRVPGRPLMSEDVGAVQATGSWTNYSTPEPQFLI